MHFQKYAWISKCRILRQEKTEPKLPVYMYKYTRQDISELNNAASNLKHDTL